MRKFFIMAATAAALTSAAALARPVEGEQRFAHGGETYAYTVRAVDGAQVIEGRRLSNGQPFRFKVANGRVRGVAGGVPVAFRVAEARGATATDLAAN